LLGDSGVGKSSIGQRYCIDVFSDVHDVTMGAAYFQQVVVLPDDQQVKLHIWDTGGSERFRTMVSLYYRDAAAAIICYDVTDEASFESVSYWIQEMERNTNQDVFVMALAGNKIDAVTEDGKKKAVSSEVSSTFRFL
jgi:Ras-related protein Rab-5C